MADPVTEYLKLDLRLRTLERNGLDDSPEMDRLRDEMIDWWYLMTPDQQKQVGVECSRRNKETS